MRIPRFLIVGVLLTLPVASVAAQTVPPEMKGHSDEGPGGSRKTLSKEESVKRIREASELFRQGALQKADSLLRGKDFAVSLNVDIDPRLLDIVYGLASLQNGDFRGAFEAARTAYNRLDPAPAAQKGKSGCAGTVYSPPVANASEVSNRLKAQAAVLRALVYGQVGITPLALESAKWGQQADPNNVAAPTLLNLHAGVGTYALAATKAHPRHAEFELDIWLGNADAIQPVVVVIRKKDVFHGALALETVPSQGKAEDQRYQLRFYDLEATPLVVGEHAATKSKPNELTTAALSFVARFNPAFGKGPYTIMRAELEALFCERDGITPLAAWWGAYAGKNSDLISKFVRQPLVKARAWNWKVMDKAKGAVAEFDVFAYANADLAKADLSKESGELEHYHFAVFAGKKTTYLASLVVTSRMLAGRRVFAVAMRHQGETQILELFDTEPDQAGAWSCIERHLVGHGNAAPTH